ncbi:MAG TPA: hypothetical protein VF427_02850 [Noviherbaspirillum sp.]
MAAVKYTKANWVAQADIQEVANGKYRGVVMISRATDADGSTDEAEHTVNTASDSPQEALEEAKALAHRLLAEFEA